MGADADIIEDEGPSVRSLGEYEPGEDPRFLGDEELPWEPDEGKIREAQDQLYLLESGYAVLGHENWRYIDGTLKLKEATLTDQLIATDDPVAMATLKGQILSIRWMRALPDDVKRAIDLNHEAIRQEQEGPEVGADGDETEDET